MRESGSEMGGGSQISGKGCKDGRGTGLPHVPVTSVFVVIFTQIAYSIITIQELTAF